MKFESKEVVRRYSTIEVGKRHKFVRVYPVKQYEDTDWINGSDSRYVYGVRHAENYIWHSYEYTGFLSEIQVLDAFNNVFEEWSSWWRDKYEDYKWHVLVNPYGTNIIVKDYAEYTVPTAKDRNDVDDFIDDCWDRFMDFVL